MKLFFIIPPISLRSGNDIIGTETISQLKFLGENVEVLDICHDKYARLYFKWLFPWNIEFRVYVRTLFYYHLYLLTKKINPEDTVWIWASAALCPEYPYLERMLKRKGATVLFHLMDDWISLGFAKKLTSREKFVDYFIVPTNALKSRLNEYCSKSSFQVLTEPINLQRFQISSFKDKNECAPIIVWTGSPQNLKKFLPLIIEVLEAVARISNFIFRIISGSEKPQIKFNFDWEWRPFDYSKEAENLMDALIGIAPLYDNIYNRCKGNYKVKTYMAAGLAVVGSDIGYNKVLIENNWNGYLVSNKDQWIDKIIHLLQNKDFTSKLGDNSRLKVHKTYNHPVVIPHWHSFIVGIIDEN